jgi:DNA-3-methyladenine glycosylase II
LARRVIDGRLDPAALAARSDDEVRSELTAVPGIGPWTADVFLMSSLGRADIWPTGDRALQVATAEALHLVATPEPAVLEEIGERWRPHRTAAAQILWHGYLSTRHRTIPGSM